ncbi:CRISPR-associated helicase Cas3' [Anaerococcus sp. AGMB00486]|uniref:CRISPR-associated helicase Cas3 n=1 Tax=Anaerococcus faecalis TaxID=2742993 RepID=A0ABX2NCJ7_9FIRM|nr:CRISPR-associated helicase Cas3' [Anaerococcus faecalis]NVF12424.1 CRISPR-associated helicase Cas3' [Anaerococcus faecalis]
MFENLYAHIDQKNIERKQSLFDHLINTANESRKLAQDLNLENSAYIIGFLHDIGKARDEFQEKITKNSKKSVDHSTLGGILIKYLVKDIQNNNNCLKFSSYINEEENLNIFLDFCNVLIYSILSHHGQYNMIRKNKDKIYVFTSLDRITNIEKELSFDIREFYVELKKFLLDKNIDIIKIFINSFKEYENIISRLDISSQNEADENYEFKEKQFYNSMLIRLLVSILKSADVKDTINSYETVIEDKDYKLIENVKDEFVNKINLKYEEFGNLKSKINKVRYDISTQVFENSKKFGSGIYRLDLPTGAGKTLLSLAYGVNQLKYKGKDRFFYITSYLSVLEQNAKVIKDVLKNEEYILEHHSNVVEEKEESNSFNDDFGDSLEKIKHDYILDDWTNLIVLTTMVQFFNTLFKGSSSNIRRFKSLANSTIILDELQSLPVDVLYPTNLALNFLKEVMKANIVLSTATQPTYDYENLVYRLNYGDDNLENKDVLNLSKEQKVVFKRTKVEIYKNGEETSIDDLRNLILDNKDKSNLIILNTKKAVKNTYELLKNDIESENLYYLTTNLHSVDRLRIIKEIKDRLENNEKIVVISTQLIEAGVDVDFEVVIRSYTGIDSIIQSMGRCNREAKLEYGIVYLINLSREAENLDYIKSLKERKEAGRYALSKLGNNQDIEEIIPIYFKKLYTNLDYNRLSYKIKESNFVDLLSFLDNSLINIESSIEKISTSNESYLNNFEILATVMTQSFKSAYNNFNLIENKMDTAIVECEDTKDYINDIRDLEISFRESYDFSLLKKMKNIVRKLNPYSVSIGKNNLESCEEILDGKIYILNNEFYDDKIGVNFESNDLFII